MKKGKGDLSLEFSVLKTIFDKSVDNDLKLSLVGALTEDSFAFEESKSVWKFITEEYLEDGKGIPSFKAATKNPEFPTEVEPLFKKGDVLLSEDDISSATKSLKEYSNRRKLVRLIEKAADDLRGGKIKSRKILSDIEDSLVEIRSGDKKNEDIATGGVEEDLSTKKLLNSVLSDEKDKLSPTGFKQLDKLLGGGCGDGDLILITANTGGGKSAAVCNMLKYIYSVNHENVVLISLEMKNVEIYGRLLSNLADIPYGKIKSKTLDVEDKKHIKKTWKAFEAIGDKHDCKYILWSPTEDVDIRQALVPFSNIKKGSWIILDYLNLLNNNDEGLSEAQALSKASRYAKRWAQGHGCKVALLSQLDGKTEDIRYSRAVKEHANVWVKWNYTEEDRETQVTTWTLGKSRSSELGDFEMRMNLGKMRISDMTKSNSSGSVIKESKKEKDANEEIDDMLDGEDDF
jgi:replicative DNA helicase